MKGAILATAAMAAGAVANSDNLHRRHEALHHRRADYSSTPLASSVAVATSAPPTSSVEVVYSTPLIPPPEETCGCTTYVTTFYGSPTLHSVAPLSTPESSSTVVSTTTVESTAYSSEVVSLPPSSTPLPKPSPSLTPSVSPVALPTPYVTSFPTPGTYTIPATTIVVTDTTTVCGATSTAVPSGTHTIGGVTTVVTTETTITCPYATVKPTGSTVTSVIELTTYTCPVAGTYTVVPGTVTSVASPTTIIYPTPHTITPGTFTQPESTVTVVETDTTYYCPYASQGASSTAAPTTPASVPAATTAAPAPAAPTSSAAAATSASSGASTPAPAGDAASEIGVAPTIPLTGNGEFGMTYTPYASDGSCKTKDQVFQDVQDIRSKGFGMVRLYSPDCSALEFVGEACRQNGMTLIPGIWIDGSGTSVAQEQVSDLCTWGQWDIVDFVVVGNEAVDSGYITAEELASFIESATGAFRAAGWTGHVTTTEPINVWQAYGGSCLCNAVTVVGANIHPFFNSAVTPDQAGKFVLEEYRQLQSICGGKDVLNLETGWPSAGQPNGAAVPGADEQATAISEISKYAGAKSVFFSYTDDAWKAPGPYDVEQHWGCSHLFQ